MSLSVNGGSAFTPQSLAPHEPSAAPRSQSPNDLATSLLFAGGNGGVVNFAPPSSRIEGANDVSPTSATHNRPVQSPNNESEGGGGGVEDVMSMLQSILQALLKLLGGNSAADEGADSGSSDDQSVKSSAPPSGQASAAPQDAADVAPEPGNNATKTQGNSDVASTADVGKAPGGMPQDLWKDCVNAGNKFGVDPYVLAAQSKQESSFGKDLSGASAGDGVMQVEPSTRAAYSGQFQEKMGHAYDHGNQSDQVAMAALIMGSKGGDTTSQLQKYNGGDDWKPGATDSYGRVIKADEYAASVKNIAQELRSSAA